MRYLLLVPILIACQSTPKPITPPVEIPTDLIQLETSPKPTVFTVARGANQIVTISSKLLSPAAKKVKISISGSSGVEIDPKDFTLTGNASADITVTVPQNATNDKPYFYVNGQALDSNNSPVVSNGVTVKFQWTVPAPPPAP
jgi:hypothetical protein